MKKNLFTGITCLFAIFLFGCSSNQNNGYYRVHFNTCTELETNIIDDQLVKEGELAKEPVVITPKETTVKQKVSGWYTSKKYETKWDFDLDVVKSNTDLYAKWSDIHSIFYYLQGATEPIWTVSDHCVGEPLEKHDELCDGYNFYGYFEDVNCTVPFDTEKALTEDTTVYMKRDDTVYLNAASLKRRFINVAAGGSGSKAGTISEPEIDNFGNLYTDVNFGYSTSADPYIQITNPVLNISKSQKLNFEFKNLGKATSFSLYWVSKYADETYAGGTSYYTQDNCINIDLDPSKKETEMSKDDNTWIKKEVDVSSIIKDGVSTWGNSVSLIKLRLQFKYISTSEQDQSNVVRFKSITGVYDEKYVGFKDSAEVQKLCVNDPVADVKAAGDAQTSITHGLIFPKNNDKLENKGSSTYFEKTSGLLLYSKYGSNNNTYVFKPVDSIKADDYSYLRIKLSNYSYISSLGVSILTDGMNKSSGGTLAMTPQQTKDSNYYMNLYEDKKFTGNVVSITLSFNFKGVDNAILLKEIEFQASKSYQVPGINLNSSNCGGFVAANPSQLKLTRDRGNGGTVFEANSATSATTTLTNTLSTELYSALNVTFYYPNKGALKNITVTVNTAGGNASYVFKDVTVLDEMQTMTIDYDNSKGGKINSIQVSLDGACYILIRSITFSLTEANSVDYSDGSVINSMLNDWKEGMTYDASLSAGVISSPSKYIRYYFGDRYAANYRKSGNVSLAGKSKVYVIYQKTDWASTDELHVILYGLKKSDTAEYATTVGSLKILDAYMKIDNIATYDSWNIGSISIDSKYTQNVEDYYLVSQVTLTFAGKTIASPTIAVRSVVFK